MLLQSGASIPIVSAVLQCLLPLDNSVSCESSKGCEYHL